jgi:DNA invertase Pin-like site-specific DNA recombinase
MPVTTKTPLAKVKNNALGVNMLYGYARVSTDGQSLESQLSQLQGCCKVFAEKISGAVRERPALKRLLRAVKAGDTVVVTRLDRLARSTRDLLNILATLAEKRVGFRSLGEGWADTTTPHGRLMVTLLGGIAEFERELIRIRTSEGRARAIANGVRFGRPPKMDLKQRQEALRRVQAGEDVDEVAKSYKVSGTTIGRIQSC